MRNDGGYMTDFPPFELPMNFAEREIHDLLIHCHRQGVSDITISSDDRIWVKVRKTYAPVTARLIGAVEVELILSILYGATGYGILSSGEALDWSVTAKVSRDEVLYFRGNATPTRVAGVDKGIQITLRPIPGIPPRLAELGIEPEIIDNLFPAYGLVAVVGTTGSGKSTLIAAANRERLEAHTDRPVKIITFEDPIEFPLNGITESMPQPSQVEIGRGRHLNSFDQAGPNAMRRSADVILMGEMRDRETVEVGFEMSMTGHAVYSTLHVDTPAEVFDRMVSYFPVDGQPAAANKLLSVSRMFVAQKLARGVDGKVRAFRSWLVMDREVRSRLGALPYDKWAQEARQIMRERQTDFDAVVLKSYVEGHISARVAMDVANLTRREFQAEIERLGVQYRAEAA